MSLGLIVGIISHLLFDFHNSSVIMFRNAENYSICKRMIVVNVCICVASWIKDLDSDLIFDRIDPQVNFSVKFFTPTFPLSILFKSYVSFQFN